MNVKTVCVLVLALLATSCCATTIVQEWFLDSNCSTGEQVTKIPAGSCLLDSVDYCGVSWQCSGSEVVAYVYPTNDITCTGSPVGKRSFPPGKCVGPLYSDLYIIASGC